VQFQVCGVLCRAPPNCPAAFPASRAANAANTAGNPEQILCRGRSVSSPQHTCCRTCHLPSKYFFGDGASPPELPRNYFLQDVPPPRANTLSGWSVTPGTTFCRTCHLPEQILCRGWSIRDGASPPKLHPAVPPLRSNSFSGTHRQLRNHFVQKHATYPSKLVLRDNFLRDGASHPELTLCRSEVSRMPAPWH